MPTQKSYQNLSEIPGSLIKLCSQILPNRCQCPRAGEVLVTEIIAREPTETDPATSKVVQYQLCRQHAVIQQEADKLMAKAESEAGEAKNAEDASNLRKAAPQPETPPAPQSNAVQTPSGAISSPPPGSFHEQMLQAVGAKTQSEMPQGEDSPNNH